MNHAHLLALAATTLLGVAASPGSASAEAAKDLLGAWTLVSITVGEGEKKAEPYGPAPKGALMIEGNGRFSIVIVRAGIPKFAANNRESGTAEENKAAVHGSLAYFGTYALNEADRTLTVRIEASTYPNFEGSEQKRLFTLAGDTLTLANPTPSAGGGTAVQVWRRSQ
jgi:hypothetical protein